MGNNEFNWQEVEYIQKYFTTNVFPVFISGAQKNAYYPSVLKLILSPFLLIYFTNNWSHSLVFC